MNEGINEAPKLSKREEDLMWLRGYWNKVGEALAMKLTKDTGIEHTTQDALEYMAELTDDRINMYKGTKNWDGSAKTESEIEFGKIGADFLKGTRYHQTEQLAVSTLNERIEDMNTFENRGQSPESVASTSEGFASDFDKFTELAQLCLRGEVTKESVESAENALRQKFEEAVAKAKKDAENQEFGGMDGARFQQFSNGPAFERKE